MAADAREQKLQEILKLSTLAFEQQLPFHKILNLKVQHFDFDKVEVMVAWQEKLVGNFIVGSLHGGVTSAILDAAGGMMALAGALQKMKDLSFDSVREKLAKLGTVDLRIDYLRPGIGKHFIGSAKLLRSGNKVAVTRMELHNEKNKLLATGTGTYLVG